MKSFLAGCALGLLISTLGYVAVYRDMSAGDSLRVLPGTPALSNAPQQNWQQLERENAQLKLALEKLSQTHRAGSARLAQGDLDAGADKKPLTEAEITAKVYAEHFDQLQRATGFSNYTNSLEARGQTMLNDLAEKFSTETVDYSWAPGYQQKLTQIFTEVESLQGVAPGAVECRTSRCQIKIPVIGNDEANQLTAAFAEAIHDNRLDIARTEVLAAPDLSHGVLNLYIAKNNSFTAY